jgi:hypothetical protein
MELQLSPERKLARENPEKIIASLQSKGFFVQLPPTLISLMPSTLDKRLH